DDAVALAAAAPVPAGTGSAGHLTCLPRRCRFVTDGHSSRGRTARDTRGSGRSRDRGRAQRRPARYVYGLPATPGRLLAAGGRGGAAVRGGGQVPHRAALLGAVAPVGRD